MHASTSQQLPLPAPPSPQPSLRSGACLGLLRPLAATATAVAVAAGLLPLLPLQARAQVQLQLRCGGTLVEARGSAQRQRQMAKLAFSLALEADAARSAEALATLQLRLDAVRRQLQALAVEELQVGSPNTWTGRNSRITASLQVSGKLAPRHFQSLVREVGGLAGVRLAPVTSQADPAEDRASAQALLQAAYQDALRQANQLAAVMGLRQVRPLQVQLEAMPQPYLLKSAAADAAPSPQPFNPDELSPPTNRLSLQASFCLQ
jgi:uncharacterized protein YggE